MTETRSDFYVYALFRENGVPFYIGKGRGKRWSQHELEARNGGSDHRCAVIRRMLASGNQVPKIKIHEGLTEETAYAYERALILAIGRGRRGPLTNLNNGGKGGNSGCVFSLERNSKVSVALRGKPKSSEHAANIAAALTGRKRSPEECASIGRSKRGITLSAEHCAKVGAAQIGGKHSPETCARKRQAALLWNERRRLSGVDAPVRRG